VGVEGAPPLAPTYSAYGQRSSTHNFDTLLLKLLHVYEIGEKFEFCDLPLLPCYIIVMKIN